MRGVWELEGNLECGDLSPLWSARLDAAFFEKRELIPRSRLVATDQSADKSAHSKELTLLLD
jgi:hypothetical protein